MDESRFHELLHSNISPTDTERRAIQDLLLGPQQLLEKVMEERSIVRQMYNDIREKQRQLKKFIHSHLALLAPARRLPEEVLGLIFLDCLPENRNPCIGVADAPLLLCHVCRSWRRVALSIPRLWAALHVVVPPRDNQGVRMQRMLDWLRVWLSRSGTVPLNISLAFAASCHRNYDVSALLDPLISVSSRWRAIEMVLPDDAGALSRLQRLTPSDVPLLATVEFRFRASVYYPSRSSTFPFLGTPSLRSLTFADSLKCHEMPVLWERLTHLKVHEYCCRFECAAALAMLQRCVMLETCELGISVIGGTTNEDIPLSLPRLSHLSITVLSQVHGEFLFGSRDIEFPNLRSLEFNNHGFIVRPPRPELIQQLPATPALESLKLSASALTSASIVSALRNMPRLKKLEMRGEPSTGDTPSSHGGPPRDAQFLTHLNATPARPGDTVCPRLEHVGFFEFKAVDDETLLQLVLSRTLPAGANSVPVLVETQSANANGRGPGTGGRLSNVFLSESFRRRTSRSQPLCPDLDTYSRVSRLLRVVCTFRRPVQRDIFGDPRLQESIFCGRLDLSLTYEPPPVPPSSYYSPFEGTEMTV